MTTPDLYLCLDLGVDDAAKAQALPPEVAQWELRRLLLSARFDRDGWTRTWRAFPTREEALAHQDANPTLVVIPLVAETIPLADIP